MIMNRYNQARGSNAFLRMFSCAGVLAVLLEGTGGRWVVDDGGACADMQIAEATG